VRGRDPVAELNHLVAAIGQPDLTDQPRLGGLLDGEGRAVLAWQVLPPGKPVRYEGLAASQACARSQREPAALEPIRPGRVAVQCRRVRRHRQPQFDLAVG